MNSTFPGMIIAAFGLLMVSSYWSITPEGIFTAWIKAVGLISGVIILLGGLLITWSMRKQ
jgi:ABC-type multidrug transport system permease subunit